MTRSPMKRRALPRTPEERRKFAWLHDLGRCCLTGRTDIHVAHLHEGSLCMGRKVGPELTLPLCWLLHAEQHRTREFWPRAFRGDPRDWALRLHDLFEADDRYGAELLLKDMSERACREYLAPLLRPAVA